MRETLYIEIPPQSLRKHNPLHIEDYSPPNLPLTENRKHLKLNFYLRDSISHKEPNILPTLNEKSHIMNQLHPPNIRY